MSQVFHTRQFTAGDSVVICIPAHMAFPPETELEVPREGKTIRIEPREATLKDLPRLFAKLGQYHGGQRPEFEQAERNGEIFS